MYRIGSFNLRNLSAKSMSALDRDLAKIADIIREEHFDVIALQEILSEGKAFTGIGEKGGIKRSILQELGPETDWGFRWADVSKGAMSADSRGEGYAFLWNAKRLELVEGSFPYAYNRKETREMVRLPYCARFRPVKGLCPAIELRLICIHTHYGKDGAVDRTQREKEIQILMDQVYPRVADRVYGYSAPSDKREERFVPAYTILLGDYNMELWRPWKETLGRKRRPAYVEEKHGVPMWKGKVIKTAQDQFTTLKKQEDAEEDDRELRGYAHDYDHFSYAEHLFSGVKVRTQRIDAVRKYCEDDFAKYRKTISDHIPIMMEIDLK